MKSVKADIVSVGARAKLWRVLPLLCVVFTVVTFASPCARARASESSAWSLEAVQAPAPPPGLPAGPDSVPLGEVGQISFWAPNRGLLITGGTEGSGGVVPSGLYAYDGVTWHELSSQCGGAKGRIAWAGPDEFWTVADQRSGQITANEIGAGALEALSLCHFVGDAIVGSYAMPLGEPSSYVHMDAAACFSPSDCWFAGQDGQSPNDGSFHLHWNGIEVSVYYDVSDHAVTGLAGFAGKLYEGLSIGEDDTWQPEEEPAHPPVIRTIAPEGQTPLCSTSGQSSTFCNAFLFSEGHDLPEYAERSQPDALGGFNLATDGGPLGEDATQLWAGADPLSKTPSGSGPGKLTLLRDAKGSWTQLIPEPNGGSPLPAGATLAGSNSNVSPTRTAEPGSGSIAPVPGTTGAWLSLNEQGQPATVALVEAVTPAKQGEASVKLVETDQMPKAQDRGAAGPIACPQQGDCWMATNPSGSASGGWLFHLGGGAPVAPDTDPLFDGEDGVIAYRPPDSGVPLVYPDGFAEEDSLADQPQSQQTSQPTEEETKPKPKKAKPLVKKVKSRFVHGRTLVLTFTLTAKARVQLVAKRSRRVVAKTPERALGAGRHTLSLSFDPAAWPTKLQFNVKPVGASSAPSSGKSGESESNETIAT